MAVREALQKNQKLGMGVAVFLFVVAGSMIAYTFWPRGPHVNPTGGFFSDDDGQTYFSDTIYHFPPFDHNGKTAVAAMVYSGASGKFVGYMTRYSPEAKKLLADEYAKASSGEVPMFEVLHLIGSPEVRNGMEYKLPGSAHQWSRSKPFVKAPDGGDCIFVMP